MPEELDGFGMDLRFRTSSPDAIQNCFKTFIIGLRSMSDLDDLYPREYGLQNYTSRLINGKTWPRRKILGLYTRRIDAERIIEERPEDLYAGQFKVVVLVNTFVGLCVSPVALHQGFVFSRKFGKYMCMTATNLQSTPQATRIRLANSPLYGALYDNYMTPEQMDRAHLNRYVRWLGYDPVRGLSADLEIGPEGYARLLMSVENNTLAGEGRRDNTESRRVDFDMQRIRREFDGLLRTRSNE